MKKLIPFILIIALLTSSCQQINYEVENKVSEIRGIWSSCYDHISAANKTEEEYKAETDEMFRIISDNGFNTAFIHLRAFSDSFYKSEIYPYSSYIAGSQGADLTFDPFEIMLESVSSGKSKNDAAKLASKQSGFRKNELYKLLVDNEE